VHDDDAADDQAHDEGEQHAQPWIGCAGTGSRFGGHGVIVADEHVAVAGLPTGAVASGSAQGRISTLIDRRSSIAR
jgi:hypothetical protein